MHAYLEINELRIEPAMPSKEDVKDYSAILPEEVLAMCFAYLPCIRDCLAVSHVSRFWRAVATGFPALWAKIPLDEFKNGGSAELVNLLLTLSGQCPVDIGQFDHYLTARSVGPALEAHIHHIRSISWSSPIDTACFSLPAPVLEKVSSSVPAEGFLQPAFLGGLPGRLRVLDLCSPIFPSGCPALATVTEMTITASYENTMADLQHMFSLCPQLVVLSVVELRRDHEDLLPWPPVPKKLKRLTLAGSCDVIRMLPCFLVPATRTLSLTMPTSFLDALLVDLEYVTSLSLSESQTSWSIVLTALSPPDWRSITLEFPYAASAADRAYERISAYLARHALPRVVELAVPLHALWLLLRSATLDALSRIIVAVCDANGVFPWQQLDCLPRLPPSVVCVVFAVAYDATTQPHVLDVSTFLMHFATNARAGVRYIVRGFPAALVDAADSDGRERARLNVMFQDPWSDAAPPPPYSAQPITGP